MREKAERAAIILRCSPELKLAIETAAKAENRSITNFIETILMEKMAESGLSRFAVKTKRTASKPPATSSPPAVPSFTPDASSSFSASVPEPVVEEPLVGLTGGASISADGAPSSLDNTSRLVAEPERPSDSATGFSVKLPSFLDSTFSAPSSTPAPKIPQPIFTAEPAKQTESPQRPLADPLRPASSAPIQKPSEEQNDPPANPLSRMRHNF